MYPSVIGLMAHHYPIVITITKLKEILCMLLLAFLVLFSLITISNSALLDLVFTNINDICVSLSNYPVVSPDNYHPPLNIDFKLTLDSQLTFLIPRRNYGQVDYLLLYNTLSNYNWSCVFNESSIDSAVHNFTASVSEAINEIIPFVKPKNSSFPHWFLKSLIYYIKKKKIGFLINIRNLNLIIIIAVSFLITVN
jgi:hypothetical protein